MALIKFELFAVTLMILNFRDGGMFNSVFANNSVEIGLDFPLQLTSVCGEDGLLWISRPAYIPMVHKPQLKIYNRKF